MADGYPMKQAVIAPSMMYLLYPLNDEVTDYPKDKFEQDLVNEVVTLQDWAETQLTYCS